jgi:outer membrane protein assembly factor BamB
VSVGKADLAAFAPVVAGGSVFAAAADGTVVRLDAASGRQIWRVRVPATLSGGVGADEKLVAVGSAEGEVIALDADGGVVWRARVSSEVLSAPVVAGDLVVVRSADSRIFALDARDGRRRWLFQRAAPALAVRSPAGAVVGGGYVFAGFSGGKLVAVALANGGLRWEGAVSQPKGTTELERVSDVVGVPWVGEREACAVAFQGRVACFDLGNGNQLWARDISSSAGLGVDARAVYVAEDRGAVTSFERTSGRSFWRQDKLANRRLTSPLPVGPGFGRVRGTRRDRRHPDPHCAGRARRGLSRADERRDPLLDRDAVIPRAADEAHDRPRRPPERGQVDAVQPAHAKPQRARGRPARPHARSPLRRRRAR